MPTAKEKSFVLIMLGSYYFLLRQVWLANGHIHHWGDIDWIADEANPGSGGDRKDKAIPRFTQVEQESARQHCAHTSSSACTGAQDPQACRALNYAKCRISSHKWAGKSGGYDYHKTEHGRFQWRMFFKQPMVLPAGQ